MESNPHDISLRQSKRKKEAQESAADREDWRRSVAQRDFNTG